MPTVIASGSAPAAGGTVYPQDFWTYRNFNGTVQARVRDITRADGTSWQDGTLNVEWIDINGVRHLSASLSKKWGVLPPWKVVGAPVTNPYLRLRVEARTLPGVYAGQWSYFDLEMKW